MRLPYKTAKRIQSSAVNIINYSADEKILEIEYSNEKVYWYFDVPITVWKQLLKIIDTGESAGEFINKHIKPIYRFEEVEQGM